jgi:hypothetical protein
MHHHQLDAQVSGLKRALEAERAKGRSAATAALADQTAIRRVFQSLISRVREQRTSVIEGKGVKEGNGKSYPLEVIEERGLELYSGQGSKTGSVRAPSNDSATARMRPVSASYVMSAASNEHSSRLCPRPASARVSGSVSLAERRHRGLECKAGRLLDGSGVAHCRLGQRRPTSARTASFAATPTGSGVAYCRFSQRRPTSARAASFAATPTVVRQDITTDELQKGLLDLTDAEADAMIKVRICPDTLQSI